jgi:hypothetical protein
MGHSPVRDEIRPRLRQSLAWLEDSNGAPELRWFARDAITVELRHLDDERALSDVLTVLHRAVDRGDLLTLSLVFELPSRLNDDRQARVDALIPLGSHALSVGAVEPLIKIVHAALLGPRIAVPFPWIQAILEAESGDEPRDIVVDVFNDWLEREGHHEPGVAELLQKRPAIHARLFCAPKIPF